MTEKSGQLSNAYTVSTPEESRKFYDGWAEGYDAEIAENGYATPQRCAEALAAHADSIWAPIMDLGCGTGVSGAALKAAGFECIDGFDFSQAMLDQARPKGNDVQYTVQVSFAEAARGIRRRITLYDGKSLEKFFVVYD